MAITRFGCSTATYKVRLEKLKKGIIILDSDITEAEKLVELVKLFGNH